VLEEAGNYLLKAQQRFEARGRGWVDVHGKKLVSKMFGEEKLKARGSQFLEKFKRGMQKVKIELAKETKENKEMIDTYYLYIRGEATKEEMDRANGQFRDLLKTIGMGTMLVVPFSPVTIPAFVKIGNALGMDILPKWFKKKNRKKPEEGDIDKEELEEKQ